MPSPPRRNWCYVHIRPFSVKKHAKTQTKPTKNTQNDEKPIKFCIFVIFLAKNTEKRIQQQRNTYKIQRKPSNSASFVCFLVKKHVKRRQIQQNTRQNAEKTKKVQSVANKCVISSFFLSQKSLQSTIYLPIPCVAFWFRFLKAPHRRLLFAFTMCNNAWCMACQSQLKDIFIPFFYVLYDHHYNNI